MTTTDPKALAEIVRNSSLFDAQWYQQEYPEIEYNAEGNPDPAYHYANYGYKEQRLPSLLFDGNLYSSYHNLRDVPPLVHYLEHGARGDFSLYNRLPEIALKLSFGLELLPCERTLYIQSQNPLRHTFNLYTDTPVALNEKLLYLHAYGEGKSAEERQAFKQKAQGLYDATGWSSSLKALGLSDEAMQHVPEPALVLNEPKEIELSRCPKSFSIKSNGSYVFSKLFFASKKGVSQDELQKVATQEQAFARGVLEEDVTSPAYGLKPTLFVYDLERYLPAFALGQPLSIVELWCFHGKVEYSLHYDIKGVAGVSIYDRDLNLKPSYINTEAGTMNAKEVPVCGCLNEMVAFAESCAKDYAFMSVRFIATDKDFMLDLISLYPYSLRFLLGTNFRLEAGAKLHL